MAGLKAAGVAMVENRIVPSMTWMATTAGLALQQLASLGVVAADFDVSYTRAAEAHAESANAGPPSVVSPHVATNAVLHMQSPSTLHGHQVWDVGGLHGLQLASVAASVWPALWTQVEGAVQLAEQGAVPAGLALQQFASLGVVAADLVLSYTRPEAQDAKAPPPIEISPHVATKGAALQQLASLGVVAAALLLSYTRPEVQDESANAPPPLVISPHVATKGAALQQLPSLGVVAAALVLSYTRPEAQDAKAPPPIEISPHVATKGAALQQLASLGVVAAALLLSYTRFSEQDANAPPPVEISPQVATNASHTPFADVVAAVRTFPATQLLTVTAPHLSPLLLAENVDPALHALHTPFAEAVAAVRP
jgi:hypothetical protein